MAAIRKKGDYYHIRFFQQDPDTGIIFDRSFSLKTKSKREADKIKFQLEEDYEKGLLNPFDDNFHYGTYIKKRILGGSSSYGITLKSTTDRFIEERRHVKEATLRTYKRHFKMMIDKWGSTLPVHLITESDVREFCFKTTVKPVTQKSYLRHLKVFFGWLKEKGIVENDVSLKIKPPRIGDNIHKKIINDKEFGEVLMAYQNHQEKYRKRKVIKTKGQMQEWFIPLMSVYYYAGLRAKEGVELRWEFIDLQEKQIHVTNSDFSNTKSGRDRTVQMRKELHEILFEWHKKSENPKVGYVFPSPSTSIISLPLDSGRVSKQFKKFVRMAGLSEEITLHSLRHSCVSNLLRSGVPLPIVKKMMGHSSIETTMIYEHLNSKDAADEFKKLGL